MLITPPTSITAKRDTEPKKVRYTFAQIMTVMSNVMIKQGHGGEGDLIEAGTIILVSNPDGTLNVEHSIFDITIYPGSAKPEAKA